MDTSKAPVGRGQQTEARRQTPGAQRVFPSGLAQTWLQYVYLKRACELLLKLGCTGGKNLSAIYRRGFILHSGPCSFSWQNRGWVCHLDTYIPVNF
jgi:hypothetical protein